MPTVTKAMKRPSLDEIVEDTVRGALEKATNEGCQSVSEYGHFLGIERSRAFRLLKRYGYNQEAKWTAPTRRRKTATPSSRSGSKGSNA